MDHSRSRTGEMGERAEWLRSKLTNDAFASLDEFSQLPDLNRNLATALACLSRMNSLCAALFGGAWVSLRLENRADEHIYQALLKSLTFNLARHTETEDILRRVQAELPEMLPFGDDCPEDWKFGLQPSLATMQALVVRLCVSLDIDPWHPGANVLFLTYDDSIGKIEAISLEQNNEFEKNVLDSPIRTPDKSASQARQGQSRAGRTPIAVQYEDAQKVWWEIVEKFEEAGDSRKPSQRDLCDRLTAGGLQISVRTLRQRISTWRDSGRTWPPPLPDEWLAGE